MFFVFDVQDKADKPLVVEMGPYFFGCKPLVSKPWGPVFVMKEEKIILYLYGSGTRFDTSLVELLRLLAKFLAQLECLCSLISLQLERRDFSFAYEWAPLSCKFCSCLGHI